MKQNVVIKNELPAHIYKAFKTKYPDAENAHGYYIDSEETFIFSFFQLDMVYEVVFDKEGSWLESIIELSITDVPKKLLHYLDENYDFDTYEDLVHVQNEEEEYLQISFIQGQRIYSVNFDLNGQFKSEHSEFV